MDQDRYINLVKEAGGFDHLQHLQIHVNKKIREESVNIIKKFWKIENQKMEVVDNQEKVSKMDEN